MKGRNLNHKILNSNMTRNMTSKQNRYGISDNDRKITKMDNYNAFSILNADDDQMDDLDSPNDNRNVSMVSMNEESYQISRPVQSLDTESNKDVFVNVRDEDIPVEVKTNNTNNNDWTFTGSVSKRDRYKDKRVKQNYPKKDKEIYDETIELSPEVQESLGNNLKLNTYWNVWVHRTNSDDWTLTGYQKIYMINSVGSFWRFFNNFHTFDKFSNHIFIMREDIAPIWEDVNNKFGGICSIKLDSLSRGYRTDISSEIMTTLCILIMNETFVKSNNINGISFSIKKRSVLIKLWTKTFEQGNDFTNSLPVTLFDRINNELDCSDKYSSAFNRKENMISIQYKPIKPEYEI